jgi:hypothetical protein
MTTGEERKDFHELYGDDPFDDERRAVPDGGVRARLRDLNRPGSNVTGFVNLQRHYRA